MSTGIDEKEQLANNLASMLGQVFPDINLRTARAVIDTCLGDYQVQKASFELVVYDEDSNEKLFQAFIVSKRVNGRTERTLDHYYKDLKRVFGKIGKPAASVTTNDLRVYFAKRELNDHVSATTRDNERRSLSSFYQWLVNEGVLARSPVAKIDAIKGVKEKKQKFSDMDVELIRAHCKTPKEKLIVELFLSTGCRVTELCMIKPDEIDGNRLLVHGKGQKDRICFLNAKAILALQEYLKWGWYVKRRSLGAPYLFPRDRMADGEIMKPIDKSSVENILRKIGQNAGVKKVHPHRFRRTVATNALKSGMPIEQVSRMLGHENISTTQIYLDLSDDDLAEAHRKYVR